MNIFSIDNYKILAFSSIFLCPLSYSIENIQNENNNLSECSISSSLSNSPIFLNLTSGQFKPKEKVELPSTLTRVSITCSKPTYLNFNILDVNFSNIKNNEKNNFSLGSVNGNGVLGYFNIEVKNGTIDGVPAYFYLNSELDKKSSSALIYKDKTYGMVKKNNGLIGSSFLIDVVVSPYLNSLIETKGPIVDGASIDGNAELFFSFGI